MPIFHNIPIGFGNIASVVVSQEEFNYQSGNPKEDIGFQDCLPWEELSNLARHCHYKCLPVIAQGFYEELPDRPRCQNGSHHNCISNVLWQVQVPIYLLQLIYEK